MIFCTLFNWSYVPQGVALYRSIERHLGPDFVLYVLCMDGVAARCIDSLNLPNIRIIHLHEIEDEALLAVKPHRSIGEYCWTCTTPLLQFVQSLYPAGTVVTYVDADIAFFSSPMAILDEMGAGSIYIHEHDFAPEFQHLLAQSGRFNVGVTAFRKDEQGQACLDRWRHQCIDECVMDPAAGKCGDQNYLDEWPILYPGLVIAANPGIGLAPWNITKHRLGIAGDVVVVGSSPAVFFHFHGLRLLRPRLGVYPTLLFSGAYQSQDLVIEAFYAPYATECWSVAEQFLEITTALRPLPDISPRMADHQVLFLRGSEVLSTDENVRMMGDLYGFDEARQPLSAA